MKSYSFKAVVEPDEDSQGNAAWFAYCPALESIGAAASGRTPEEALSNVNQVVRMIVQEFIEEGVDYYGSPRFSHKPGLFQSAIPL